MTIFLCVSLLLSVPLLLSLPSHAAVTTALSVEQTFSPDQVPAYTSSPVADVNGGKPYFQDADLTETSFESYSELDSLGRCGEATACVGTDLMPDEPRGEIGEIRPSGWHLVKYEGIDGNYLYNRCHLIAYELTGENANPENLITGTRYLNVKGMLPYENEVADYVRSTGNHVLYRVTPIFEDENLLASGVLMEAESVEDDGAGVCFNVYCYDVQPGIVIDYATGDSSGIPYTGTGEDSDRSGTSGDVSSGSPDGSSAGGSTPDSTEPPSLEESESRAGIASDADITYIVNTNTGKFHLPGCSSVQQMAPHNTWKYSGTREELIALGYEPCRNCNP